MKARCVAPHLALVKHSGIGALILGGFHFPGSHAQVRRGNGQGLHLLRLRPAHGHQSGRLRRRIVEGNVSLCLFVFFPAEERQVRVLTISTRSIAPQSAVVELVNLSDLPAKVALNYQSKVVTFRQRQITIPPRQSADLKVDFVPRKINPDYRYGLFNSS